MIPGMQRRDDSTVRNMCGGWYSLVLAATHRPHAIIMFVLSTLLSFSNFPGIPMSTFASIYLPSFKMCKRLIFLIALLVPSVVAAQNCPAPPTAPSNEKIQALAKAAKDRGFLWKIEKDGRTGYLYGTIHVNKLEWSIPGPKTVAALAASELIAFELDILDPDIQAQFSDPAKFGIKPTVLPAKLKQRMEVIAQRVCAPAAAIAAMHPIMQLATLTILDARFAELEIGYGSEIVMTGFARSAKKTVTSLETAELQMHALMGGESDEIIASVENGVSLFEANKQRKPVEQMINVWATSNFAEFQNYEKWCECVSTEAEAKFYRRLNDERNPGLAAGNDKLHRDGKSVFAAVGALHLANAGVRLWTKPSPDRAPTSRTHLRCPPAHPLLRQSLRHTRRFSSRHARGLKIPTISATLEFLVA